MGNANAVDLTGEIIGAAIRVHRTLGPGLLESTYEICLAHELAMLGLEVERQLELPVRYRGVCIERAYRIDLLVHRAVVVELKAAQGLTDLDRAQLLSYLKLSGHRVGLLINFNVTQLRHGVRRVVN